MATIQDLGKVAYFNKGAYNSQTNYEINDVVSYNGSSYVSLLNNNQGNLPTNATYWSVVALKGDKGDTGKPFVIEKTYESIEDMVADYDNMQVNDYVMIQGNIEEEENATLWTKTETEVSPYKWVYLADFSGASGITGATPNIQIGTVTEGNEPSVTRRAGSSNENPILDFVLKTGATGQTGATGNGISSVSKTSTSGLTDTYTITYTNGNTTTFNVSNGKGIASIVKTGTSGLVDTYTITYNDGTTSTYTITNGEDGEVTKEELEEEVDRLSMIYNLFPTTSDEDTEMTLDGTGEVKLKKIGLKGNTYQESTTGKNLFDNVYGQTRNVYTKHIDASSPLGSLDCYPINLLPNTQYTLKIDMNGYQKNSAWIAGVCFENGDVISLLQLGSMADITTTTFTTDSTGVVYVGQRYGFTYGETGRMDLLLQTAKIQLEKGSTATDWEKYSGGNPTPNPDYPQDIQVVTGNNSIEVVGKQLFEQEYIIAPDDNNKNAHLKAGTYTLATCDGNGFGTHVYFKLFDKNNNAITTSGHLTCSNVQINFSTSSYNYYGGAGASYMTITIDNDYTIAIGLLDATGNRQVMLVKGSEVVRTYAPYQSQSYAVNLGNIELCKIGDYQDYIYKYSGKWYLNKQIGKVVLDGSESWNYGASGATGTISSSIQISSMLSGDYLDGLATYFHNDKSGKAKNSIRFGANSKYIYLYLDETEYTSANDVKAFLSTHNVKIYYVLATPTITEITDTTLIEQLDNLENAYSYDTQTNITQTNDDMPFILDVEALMSLKGVLN